MVEVRKAFARALSESTSDNAITLIKKLIHEERNKKTLGRLEQALILFEAARDQPSWVDYILQHVVDPGFLVFDDSMLQWINNFTDDLSLFQKLCENYRRNNKKGHVVFHTFENKPWLWVEAYLPFYLQSHCLSDARSEIYSFASTSFEKKLKVKRIREIPGDPFQWSEIEMIDNDVPLLTEIVRQHGGWDRVPSKSLHELMQRAISLNQPPTIECLLDNTELTYLTDEIWSTFIDFESCEIYDDPVSDRLIRLWKIPNNLLHAKYEWLEDKSEYPSVERLLARYPLDPTARRFSFPRDTPP